MSSISPVHLLSILVLALAMTVCANITLNDDTAHSGLEEHLSVQVMPSR